MGTDVDVTGNGFTCAAQCVRESNLGRSNPGAVLDHWFGVIGERQPREDFGALTARVAMTQLGVVYHDAPQPEDTNEPLDVTLDSFQCVSLVESVLSVARCVWKKDPSERCYVDELGATRYRNGHRQGYASRLHYFFDWLLDNGKRQRLALLGREIGAESTPHRFSVMTNRADRYPALKDPETFKAIRDVEKRLTSSSPQVVPATTVAAAESLLRDGDIIGVTTKKPGLLISHVGFARRMTNGELRYLHASSFHGRVVLTRVTLGNYIAAKPNRSGVIAAVIVIMPRDLFPGPRRPCGS